MNLSKRSRWIKTLQKFPNSYLRKMAKKSRCKGCWGWCLVFMVLATVAFGVFIVFKVKHRHSDDSYLPEPSMTKTKKYASALKIAMRFFDIQKSGKFVDNTLSWRGNSGLKDGSQAKLDLSKGMYDAGDGMKFGFPLAYTATVLSWSILEYGNQMKALGQLESAKNSLKWITDFLINAHPSKNVLYIQVGNPKVDHSCWNRPEDMTEPRPLTQVNTSSPGTEVAAETAAAMASASLVFKSTDSAYSSLLLKHAAELFTFADKHRKSYSISIREVQSFYNSTGYGDELLWAASWLYHATGEQAYFEYVAGENGKEFADWGTPTWFCWDNKLAATQVLLSRISFFGPDVPYPESLLKYKKSAEAVMCGLIPDSPTATSSRTDGGLIWVSEWNSLQHPVATSFLAVLYSDYMRTAQTNQLSCDGNTFTPSDLRKFAQSQADYVLGNNPMKMSYLVGYGDKYPKFVHHRGASIPADEKPGCKEGFKWLDSKDPNPNVVTGALVGGPFLNETYHDLRNNSMQGEPSTYNTALLVGLLSGLASTSSAVKSFTN